MVLFIPILLREDKLVVREAVEDIKIFFCVNEHAKGKIEMKESNGEIILESLLLSASVVVCNGHGVVVFTVVFC